MASQLGRRAFVFLGGAAGAAFFTRSRSVFADQRRGSGRGTTGAGKPIGDEGVAPPEDLMREHGVLKRVMLIYDEAVRRIDAKQDVPEASRPMAAAAPAAGFVWVPVLVWVPFWPAAM